MNVIYFLGFVLLVWSVFSILTEGVTNDSLKPVYKYYKDRNGRNRKWRLL